MQSGVVSRWSLCYFVGKTCYEIALQLLVTPGVVPNRIVSCDKQCDGLPACLVLLIACLILTRPYCSMPSLISEMDWANFDCERIAKRLIEDEEANDLSHCKISWELPPSSRRRRSAFSPR